MDTATRVDLDSNGRMRDWLRLTFRQDGAARTWDLYADGKHIARIRFLMTSGLNTSFCHRMTLYDGVC